jgi:hypothetical protein
LHILLALQQLLPLQQVLQLQVVQQVQVQNQQQEQVQVQEQVQHQQQEQVQVQVQVQEQVQHQQQEQAQVQEQEQVEQVPEQVHNNLNQILHKSVIFLIVKNVKSKNVQHAKQDTFKMMKEDACLVVNWVYLKQYKYNYLRK